MFRDEFIPTKEDAVRSILDYAINIFPLAEEEKQVIVVGDNDDNLGKPSFKKKRKFMKTFHKMVAPPPVLLL